MTVFVEWVCNESAVDMAILYKKVYLFIFIFKCKCKMVILLLNKCLKSCVFFIFYTPTKYNLRYASV